MERKSKSGENLKLADDVSGLEAFSASLKRTSRPRVIFFMHTTFPTSEIFRLFAQRKALLLGILAADVIGFHSFDHARHFLTACKRFVGVSYQSRR